MFKNRFITGLGVVLAGMTACTKETVVDNGYSEAAYQLTITGTWKSPELAVPSSAHFTPVVGMVHNSSGFMFRAGVLATRGVEAEAEDGNAFPLLAEIDSMIAARQAIASFILFFPQINGQTQTSFYANSNFSRCSFMSMLAPTPDWFTGLSDVDLHAGGNWVKDTTINVYTWDAGTEEGDVFNQTNMATVPQEKVGLLTVAKGSVLANGNATLAPVARVRFVKK